MFVSIIIGNFNNAKYLSTAITSALNQSFPQKEVIVVDDGSTDNSRSVVHAFGDRIIPVFKENGGQASTMNRGFAASRGDIIIFLDSDDLLLPHAVKRITEAWQPNIAKMQYPLKIIDGKGYPNGLKR